MDKQGDECTTQGTLPSFRTHGVHELVKRGHRGSVFSVENVSLTWSLLSLQSLQQVELGLETVASSGCLVETKRGVVLRVRELWAIMYSSCH